mgnify:CR=1 FL=1
MQNRLGSVVVDNFPADLMQAIQHVDISLARLQAAVMPRRHIDAQLIVLELPGANLIRVGARFDIHAALRAAIFIQRECQRRLVADVSAGE